MEDHYTIGAVERLTGVPQELIRTWERRYGALTPSRTPTNRRRYSRQDVERLRLIKAAIEAGASIGAVANAKIETLREMAAAPPSVANAPGAPTEPRLAVEQCLDAAKAMDARTLDQALAAAATDLGPARFASDVAAPLLARLGDAWRADALHPAQEHLATEVVRARLARLLATNQPEGVAPVAVAATLRGQAHDLGALLAAVVAAVAGWSVRFLGSSLPAEEIAWAATSSGARLILLSVVYPPDDPRLPSELAELRRLVGPDLPIAVGGRAAQAYAKEFDTAGVLLPGDLQGLRDVLDKIR